MGSPPIFSFTLSSDDIAGSGDLACSRGSSAMTMAPPGGAATADSGKFLEIYRKPADGSWKVGREMFS